MSLELTAGNNRERLRLWDKYWRMRWDSCTATTPAYQHITTWGFATIDYPDGTRWVGQMCRTPAGIQRETLPQPDYLRRHILKWPTFEWSDG